MHSVLNLSLRYDKRYNLRIGKVARTDRSRVSRQVERIAQRKEFHLVENERDIYITGNNESDDYDNLIQAARKAVSFEYTVYILPNPTEIRTPDFILEKKNTYRVYDLKTVFGKSSIGQSLIDSIGQCNRILLNIQTDYNTRLLISDVKRYFEANPSGLEVLIFKGKKRISIDKFVLNHPSFYRLFKKKV